MIEEWRAIPGIQGPYEVSSLGRVRSLDHDVTYPLAHAKSGTVTRHKAGRILTPGVHPWGYLKVSIGGQYLYVHALVLRAFVGPPPPGQVGLHYDDEPTNNRLDNLRWGTRLENKQDSKRNGGIVQGERHYAARLTAAQVIELRRIKTRPERIRAAQKYGISEDYVRQIAKGTGWKHVPMEIS